MTAIIQLLPIVLLILMIFLFLKSKNKNVPEKSKRKRPQRKVARIIFLSYAVLLVLAMVTYYVLPATSKELPAGANQEEVSDQPGWEIYEKATQNRFNDIDPAYLEEQKVFEYKYTSLVLPDNLPDRGDFLIVATIDNQLSEEIKMDIYKTPFSVNGVDITDEIVRPSVTIQNNQLFISDVYGQNDLHYIQYLPSMIVQQFNSDEENNEGFGFGTNYSYGVQVIHLYVPEDVAIIGEVRKFIAQ